MTETKPAYQLLPPLSRADRQRLRDSIEREGLLEPVVRDAETGEILDGHHREELAKAAGVAVTYREVSFEDDRARKIYALAINLVRRRLSDRQWGEMFEQLVELRGARLGSENSRRNTTDKLSDVAEEQGVNPRAAWCPWKSQSSPKPGVSTYSETTLVLHREAKSAGRDCDNGLGGLG